MREEDFPGLGHFQKMSPVLRPRVQLGQPTACLSTFFVINCGAHGTPYLSCQQISARPSRVMRVLFNKKEPRSGPGPSTHLANQGCCPFPKRAAPPHAQPDSWLIYAVHV